MTPAPTEDFLSALQVTAEATNAALSALLTFKSSKRLEQAMRYAALGQGKRLRPFLVVESAKLFDVPASRALQVAVALELVHCYSLIHDDLPAMDNDDLRRGQPTTHRQFDEATAILAGDGLLTLAFEVLTSVDAHPQASVRCDLIAALASAAGANGMVGGQMLDIEAEKSGFESLEAIQVMQSKKTGALFEFACVAGAILAGADQRPLKTFAQKAGLAFQIADDVLDVESSPEHLGKATQKDAHKGKATFVDHFGLAGAKAEARRLVDDAIAVLAVYGDKGRMLAAAAEFMIARRK